MAGFNVADNTFSTNTNAFSKCSPAISTNIKECGTVTQCNAKPMTSGDLTSVYMKSSQFRVMEALFHHDMEIKMCEAVQNGLYDFLMANKVNLSKRLSTRRLNAGEIDIAPFVMARQYSPINNEYWAVTNGASSGDGNANHWTVRVASTTNIPANTQSFPVGLRVFIQGKSPGGSATKTAWTVVTATLAADGTYVTLVLNSGNDGSKLLPAHADKLYAPAVGVLTRGTPNISDFEKWCNEAPSYLNWKNVPFWTETTRNSMCRSDLYAKWRKLVLADNALYREFFDLPEIEKNKQIGADFQRRLVQQMFFGKPISTNQTTGLYDNLDSITIPTLTPTDLNGNSIGAEGGRCIGKRANMIGVYEQHAECGRVLDLQAAVLNIPALAKALYNMMRIRKANGTKSAMSFDIFTDSITAEKFNQGMLAYYQDKSLNMARLNINGEGFSIAKKADFGFLYRSYSLFWPQGVVVNLITHEYFDDLITAGLAADATLGNQARVFWILDFSGIYPGIIASNRVVNKNGGDLKTLSQVSADAACVMETAGIEWTHTSMLMTMIVECTMGNLLIENFADHVPSIVDDGSNYDTMASGSSTSTTTNTTIV